MVLLVALKMAPVLQGCPRAPSLVLVMMAYWVACQRLAAAAESACAQLRPAAEQRAGAAQQREQPC